MMKDYQAGNQRKTNKQIFKIIPAWQTMTVQANFPTGLAVQGNQTCCRSEQQPQSWKSLCKRSSPTEGRKGTVMVVECPLVCCSIWILSASSKTRAAFRCSEQRRAGIKGRHRQWMAKVDGGGSNNYIIAWLLGPHDQAPQRRQVCHCSIKLFIRKITCFILLCIISFVSRCVSLRL